MEDQRHGGSIHSESAWAGTRERLTGRSGPVKHRDIEGRSGSGRRFKILRRIDYRVDDA